jgi:hypothetical protein
VTNDGRLIAENPAHPPVALREPSTEFIDGRIRISADGIGVLSNPRASVDAGRPPVEVVGLEACEQFDWDLGRNGYVLERNTALHAEAPEVRAEGIPGHDCPEPQARSCPFARVVKSLQTAIGPTDLTATRRLTITVL